MTTLARQAHVAIGNRRETAMPGPLPATVRATATNANSAVAIKTQEQC